MSKKLLISVAPLLATVAFAMAPAAAQAANHQWYSEGSPISSTPIPVTIWGNLSLKGAAEINCHNVIGSDVDNVGGIGKGFIETFGSWDCTSNFACPAGTSPGVEPQNLPWPNELIETAGKIRSQTTGVEVVIGCTVPPEDHVTGTTFVIGAGEKQTPLAPAGTKKGTGAAHPGVFSYDSGSGQLEAKGSGGTVTGVTEGEVKALGFEEQEHIYTQ